MANIPGAISVGGGDRGPGAFERVLMTLVASAPSALMQYLQMQQQAQYQQGVLSQGQQQIDAQNAQQRGVGQANLASLGGAIEGGTINSPSAMAAFMQAGGQYTPARPAMPGVQGTAVGQNKPISIAPQAARAPRADTSGIDPMMGSQLLTSILGTQKSVTENEGAAVDLAMKRFDAEIQQLYGEREVKGRLALQDAQTDQARAGAATQRASIFDQAIGRAQSEVEAMDRRWQALVQTYAQTLGDAAAAKTAASIDVYGDLQPPDIQAYVMRRAPELHAGMVSGQMPRTSFGARFGSNPTVEKGRQLGLSPDEIGFIITTLESGGELGKQRNVGEGAGKMSAVAQVLDRIEANVRRQAAGMDTPIDRKTVDEEVGYAQAQSAMFMSFILGIPISPTAFMKRPAVRTRAREALAAVGPPASDIVP